MHLTTQTKLWAGFALKTESSQKCVPSPHRRMERTTLTTASCLGDSDKISDLVNLYNQKSLTLPELG
jgi:hypothetical protein